MHLFYDVMQLSSRSKFITNKQQRKPDPESYIIYTYLSASKYEIYIFYRLHFKQPTKAFDN